MCNELSTLRDPGTYDCLFPDEDFASWSRRATFVIETAKVDFDLLKNNTTQHKGITKEITSTRSHTLFL
jgi:hypothetical protein